MTKRNEIYKCLMCGNVVEVTHEGVGTLVCCDEEMKLLSPNDATNGNPHFACIKEIDEITKKVILNHVVTPEHHIEYIEAISNDEKYIKRKYLNIDEVPEMEFKCNCKSGFYIRLYCNKDNVWITKH